MKASQTKAVIVLTCCALQSACYSPTGIVILFILSHFGAEVQTNRRFYPSFFQRRLKYQSCERIKHRVLPSARRVRPWACSSSRRAVRS